MQSYRFSLLICGSAFGWKFEIKVLWGSAGREILEKMATWKGNYLSFGGIQTLIQAALSSLPVCFDPYSKPQKRWYRNLNHCKENFLWKGRELNKPHLIKDVSRSQKNGELGIGGIANRNVALLGKWHWLFPKERHSLWASILRCKCGFSLNVWDFNQILPSSDHSPWKSIITSLPSILAFSKTIVDNLHNIRFG